MKMGHKKNFPVRLASMLAAVLLFFVAVSAVPAMGSDGENIIPTGRLAIVKTQESLQMVVNTSQYLTFPQSILKATVQNDEIGRAHV